MDGFLGGRSSVWWEIVRTVNMSGVSSKCIEMDLVNKLYNKSFKVWEIVLIK